MASNIPSSYDYLSMYGILPYDANKIITGESTGCLKSNNNLTNTGLKNDVFQKKGKNINPKKAGMIALMTYLGAALLTRSKNPVKIAQKLGKNITKIGSKFAGGITNLIKKVKK